MYWRSYSATSLASLAIRHFSSGANPTHFTYTLASSPSTLYVPITSHCNSRSLPATRGPSFVLPAVVVAALCRVRDAESGTSQWEPWCRWLDTQPAEFSIGLPPPPSPVTSKRSTSNLPNESEQHEPSCETLLQEIVAHQPKTVVLAGEGEPFLRPKLVLDLVEAIVGANDGDTTVRINTNGLAVPTPSAYYSSLPKDITTLSIALMTADPEQYTALMQPSLHDDSHTTDNHARVVNCIQSAIQAGIAVEATAVALESVDQEATEQLAQQLGCTVRWRPYFP